MGQLFDQKVSPNTIERLSHHVGTALVRQADQAFITFQASRCIPPSQRRPKRLYIAADGTTVHETDVGKRLKQSGMIWKRTGSSAILALRIAWLNEKWELLWAGKPLAA